MQEKVRDLQIRVPMGLGLDEATVYDIAKWQFEPAQLNGEPVDFLGDFETCFKLY